MKGRMRSGGYSERCEPKGLTGAICALALASLLGTSGLQAARAAQVAPGMPDPSETVAEMISVACRQDTARFPEFLTRTNAAYYKQLPTDQQVAILRRIVLLQEAGRSLLSSDPAHHPVVHCETPAFTLLIRIGAPRVEENLAYVPVALTAERKIEFGMILSNGGWKFISLGLLMFDLPQLTVEWAAQDMEVREDGAMAALRKVAQAINTYYKAFEKLPESLAQLGPPPKEGISDQAAGLLDAELAAGRTDGYALRYRIVSAGEGEKETQFELAATPTKYGTSGVRSFFLDSSGKMRGADKQGGPATAADDLVEESPAIH